MASVVELKTEGIDWQIGKSLNQCLGYMLDKSIQTDVAFIFSPKDGDKVEISAHKLILGARSPVFAAMFDGRFREASEPVEITDIEPGPFKDMLRYIYTDDVAINGENVLHVQFAAKKYLLQGLQDKCRTYLEEEMADENVCAILTNSVHYGEEDLVKRCLEYAAPRAKDIIRTDAFFKMSQPALLKFLENDKLSNGIEDDLFIAAIKWATDKVHDPENPDAGEIRSLLGDCIFQIRYGTLNVKRFADAVGDYDVLTSDEKNLFFCFLANGNTKYRDNLVKKGFNVKTRWLHCGNRGTLYGNKFGLACRKPEVFTFTPNKPIIYLGLKILGGPKGSEHTIDVTLTDVSTGEKLSKTNGTYIAPDGTPIDVLAEVPVQLCLNTYRVDIGVTGSHTGYFCSERTETSSSVEIAETSTSNVKITFSKEIFPYDMEGKRPRGRVCEIIFQTLV